MQKAPNSFVVSVRLSLPPSLSLCLSVRMYDLGPHRTDFGEIWYWRHSLKYVHKIQINLQSDKNVGNYAWRPKYGDMKPP
jgi:hypothetical protein